MRICFVCREYPPGPHGGIGTMTQVLARALVRAGHGVRVVGVYPAWQDWQEKEKDCGVEVYRLRRPAGRLVNLRSRLKLFSVVKSWVQAEELDLVEVPDWEGWAGLWPQLAVPVVTRLNGSSIFFHEVFGTALTSLRRFWESASLRRADAHGAVSRHVWEVTARLCHLEKTAATILYNPVEVGVNGGGWKPIGRRVTFAGSLHPKKGIESLIQAWPTVVRAMPDSELHVFGKDTSTSFGESMVLHLQKLLGDECAPTVTFHGHVPREELSGAYRVSSAAVFPSFAEAFAIAPLEAMAEGCPTIYTRRSSGTELIEHGVNGLLVDPEKPAEIAGAILHLLRDPEVASRLGAEGRETVRRKFSVATLLPQNIEFYKTTIQKHHARVTA